MRKAIAVAARIAVLGLVNWTNSSRRFFFCGGHAVDERFATTRWLMTNRPQNAPAASQTPSRTATAAQVIHLRSTNLRGGLFVTLAFALTGISLFLSTTQSLTAWLVGQGLLGLAIVQWFVLLHECGHGTLFRTKWLNHYTGHLASFFSVIPFSCWTRVHALHHIWTGWQDVDPTTASLVPRELGRIEKFVVNLCWKLWIPLFSVFYRINNFWNVGRLRILFPDKNQQRKLAWNIVFLLSAYAGLIVAVGVREVIHLGGLALLLGLIFEDPLLLSQHTHIPLRLSQGERVRPFSAIEQEPFTRSLRFPRWFSTAVLLNLDAHELHHMYPYIPGYHLRQIPYTTRNEMHWWRWLREAKRLPGEVFLFQNRNQTGLEI